MAGKRAQKNRGLYHQGINKADIWEVFIRYEKSVTYKPCFSWLLPKIAEVYRKYY